MCVVQQFCTLVENLLEQHLLEIGCTAEQFVETCEKFRSDRDINMMVFDQLLAVEDFMSACLVPPVWCVVVFAVGVWSWCCVCVTPGCNICLPSSCCCGLTLPLIVSSVLCSALLCCCCFSLQEADAEA